MPSCPAAHDQTQRAAGGTLPCGRSDPRGVRGAAAQRVWTEGPGPEPGGGEVRGTTQGEQCGGSMWGEQRGRLRGLVPSHSPPAPALETLVVDRPVSLPHRQRWPEAAAGLDLVLDDRDPRGKKGGRRGPSTRGGGARLLAWWPKLRSRGRPASVPRPHKGDSPRRAAVPRRRRSSPSCRHRGAADTALSWMP